VPAHVGGPDRPVAVGDAVSLSQCVYCGCDLVQPTLELDHVIPLCRGGADVAKNKAPCCVPCNRLKGPLTAREFLATRDEPGDLEALKREVLRELGAYTPRPLPAVPPVPPPNHGVRRNQETWAQRQAAEREKSQRARARIKAGECVAELGFTCHCPVCGPPRPPIQRVIETLPQWEEAERQWDKEVRG
jgi:hypothetical protein